ncbi:MAG: TolC family protein [Candidatus Omnitrophota bacterium]
MKTIKVFWYFLFSLCFIGSLCSAETLTLEQALNETRSKSLSLRQAEEQIKAAEFGAAEQRTYLYPSFALSGSYSYQNGEVLAGPETSTAVNNWDSNAVSFGITQPLYTGGELKGQYESAKLAVDLARLAYDQEVLNLGFEVRESYFAALRLEKAVAVTRELVNNRQRHLSEVEKRVKVGVLPKVEQLKSEVELAHSQDNLVSAENSLKVSFSGLNRLLERPLDMEWSLSDVVPRMPPVLPDMNSCCQQALQTRPDRKSAHLKVMQMEKGVSVARSGYYPRVDLQLVHEEFQDDAFSSGWNYDDQVLVTVSYDLWNWGRVKDKVNASQSQKKQAETELAGLERSIRLEVKNAYLSVLSAQARIGTAEKAVDQAKEVLRMQTIRFQEGMATNTDVLDADFALAQVQTDYYNARYDYLTAEAILRRTLGVE